VPRVPLEPDELLHVLVPSRAIARTVEAVSPRIRAYRIDAEDGPPTGEAARAQVWVPRSGGASLPPGFVEALPRLRLVQLLSAGAERFVGRLPEGVLLCNARGAHTPSTAEWAVAATLAAQRGIPFFVREQAAGRWSSTTFSSLVGARVLVVGAGDIGRTIGRMLAGFDVELTYVARTARDGVRSTAELPELLPDADVVILIVPVTPETTGMVDAAFLAAMPDGALLVNAARGVVVDTDALLAELSAGRLRAALDVTDPEPLPEGHPLWSSPGLLLTPHVGGAVPDTNERAAAAVTDQLARILAGEPLVNVVDRY
jgi:phosphoglycerate dehydrogenase-like enzyme